MARQEPMISPAPEDVLAAREAIQVKLGIGITAAQDWCAAAVHTKRRPWQQWEAGDRAMHPAFWELFGIKRAMLDACSPSTASNTAKSR